MGDSNRSCEDNEGDNYIHQALHTKPSQQALFQIQFLLNTAKYYYKHGFAYLHKYLSSFDTMSFRLQKPRAGKIPKLWIRS